VEQAADAFQRALASPGAPPAARLNLGLLHLQRRRLEPALEAYREALVQAPQSAAAWNGIGLVLMELKRWGEARTALSRAVEADAGFAAAHYNLSFSLSQLGDFDGALRATKRALELDPYYVPQKYALTIDLQFENPTIAVPPDLAADVAGGDLGTEFAFDPSTLDRLFRELAPAPEQPAKAAPTADPLALARDYISKGMLERAAAELSRARARGAAPAAATALLGDLFARRGLHGEALERYRVPAPLQRKPGSSAADPQTVARAQEAGTSAQPAAVRSPTGPVSSEWPEIDRHRS